MPVMVLESSYEDDLRLEIKPSVPETDGTLSYALLVQQGREHLGPTLHVCGMNLEHVRNLRDACTRILAAQVMRDMERPARIMADT